VKKRKEKDNYFEEGHQEKNSVSDFWIPEKNATTGFTIKGMVMLLIVFFAIIRFLFF